MIYTSLFLGAGMSDLIVLDFEGVC
jgi:hypothetical protein